MPNWFSSSSGMPTLIPAEYSAAGQIFAIRDQWAKAIGVDVEAMGLWTLKHRLLRYIQIEEAQALAFLEQERVAASHASKASAPSLKFSLTW